jgi:hypothetical protein
MLSYFTGSSKPPPEDLDDKVSCYFLKFAQAAKLEIYSKQKVLHGTGLLWPV